MTIVVRDEGHSDVWATHVLLRRGSGRWSRVGRQGGFGQTKLAITFPYGIGFGRSMAHSKALNIHYLIIRSIWDLTRVGGNIRPRQYPP